MEFWYSIQINSSCWWDGQSFIEWATMIKLKHPPCLFWCFRLLHPQTRLQIISSHEAVCTRPIAIGITPGEGILNLFPCTCRTSMLECALSCGGTLWLSSSKSVFRVNNHFEYERWQTVKQGVDG